MGMSLEPNAHNTLMLRGGALPGILQPSAAVTSPGIFERHYTLHKRCLRKAALLSPGSEPPQETRLAASHAFCEVREEGCTLA